jgi:sensor domain CHASE-containing protein
MGKVVLSSGFLLMLLASAVDVLMTHHYWFQLNNALQDFLRKSDLHRPDDVDCLMRVIVSVQEKP